MNDPRAGLYTFLVAATLLRAAVFIDGQPAISNDSHGYVAQAERWLALDLSDDPGWRTPGYPLVIAGAMSMANERWPAALVAMQMLLGLLNVFLVVRVVEAAGGSRWVALAAAAVDAASPARLDFERAVLTETLATVLLSGALAILAWPARELGVGRLLAAGALLGWLGFTRPNWAALPLLVLAIVLLFRRHGHGGRVSKIVAALALLGPTVLLVGAWSDYNRTRIGTFSPTIVLGYSLVSHVDGFIEDAPSQYRDVARIYLDHERDIWEAAPEIMEARGLESPAELNDLLVAMCESLILDHPLEYLSSVAGAVWISLEYPSVHLGPVVGAVLPVVEGLWFGAWLMGIGLGVWLALRAARGGLEIGNHERYVLALLFAAVLYAIASEAPIGRFPDATSRYLIPVHPWIAGLGLIGVARLGHAFRTRFPLGR